MQRNRIYTSVAVLSILGTIASTGAQAAKTTTINVWAWPTADKALNLIVPDFEKKNPDIKVKIVSMPFGDVHQKLLTTLAAGAGAPDATLVEIAHIASFRAQKGLLVDLLRPPYFASKLKDDFVAYKWSHASDKGRLMALPWDIGPVGLFYRRDMFDKAGLPSDPAIVDSRLNTWDDYLLWCKKLTVDANGDRKPEQWGTANAWDIWNFVQQQNDCTIIDDDFKCRLAGNRQEAFIKALRTAKQFREGGLDQKVWFADTAKSASFMAGAWASGWVLKNQKKTNGLWGVAKMPDKVGVNNGGSFIAIPGGAKHKDQAWKFIKYACATVEAQNKMYLSEGIFPAYKPAWKAPVYDEGVPFFAGQKASKLFTQIAENTPFVKVYAEDEKLRPILDAEASKTLDKGKDPIQAIKDAAVAVQRYMSTMPRRK